MARLVDALKSKAVAKKIENKTTRKELTKTGNSFVDGAVSESLYDERTDNGMKTLSTSHSALVDLFGIAGSMRKEDIVPHFIKAFNENSLLALKLALYTRDCTEGQGNRKNFRDILYWVTSTYPMSNGRDMCSEEQIKNETYVKNMIKKVPLVGRWDDILHVDESYQDYVFSLIKTGLEDKDTQGLCAKWMPRQGAVANAIRKYLGLTPKGYRKKIVALSKTVEQKMCAKQWNEIEYSHVPSKAFKNYTNAFKKHDNVRFDAFLNKAEKGEVKVNAKAIYPYDVIANLRNDIKASEVQWKNLPDFLEEGVNILVMADGSGSMTSCIAGNVSCLDVANSLAIYTSERLKSAFKNLYLTFSMNPKFVKLEGSLANKVQIARRYNEVANTNVVAGFKLILETAKRNNVPQSDMPTVLLIISDGEFDADNDFDDSMLQSVQRLYGEAGYKVPQVVSWNVAGKMGRSPVTYNQAGTAMISGFSPTILKYIGSQDITPEKLMMKVLNKERYSIE